MHDNAGMGPTSHARSRAKEKKHNALAIKCVSVVDPKADALGANAAVSMLQNKVCLYVCVYITCAVLQ